jgi:ATP-dependent RNA helicase DBP3
MDPQHTSKKDRKRKDKSGDVSGDIEEIESRKKLRKAKKREIGSVPVSIAFEIADLRIQEQMWKKPAAERVQPLWIQMVHPSHQVGVRLLSQPHGLLTRDAGPHTEPKEKKKKKEKKSKEGSDSGLGGVVDPPKQKKNKRKRDQVSDNTAPPTSPKRPRVTISADEAGAYLRAHNISVHLPPDAPALTPIISFDALPIPDLLRGAFSGFKEPTPIQACAWPVALSGKDVVGIAETGSGKTLAFGIPALARLLSTSSGKENQRAPRALVLAPTRELALQTYDALSALKAVQCVAVFGGVDKTQQVRAIKGAQIVVGTPGRVLDLIRDDVLALGGVEYLVLDEADRMLDKGFENDIRSIIGNAKEGAARQTLMCTSSHATFLFRY